MDKSLVDLSDTAFLTICMRHLLQRKGRSVFFYSNLFAVTCQFLEVSLKKTLEFLWRPKIGKKEDF